ncbi:CD276 antigen-like isoform X3 [Scleropages formosus]|uniref:CD276 antigen-like isoform X3 n=1 Tax=Scleropages formosus TaxID=113540 RepID=UPI0010FA92E3|nr:CD276 antigen-like isoform X3 [Scleropages formosus]
MEARAHWCSDNAWTVLVLITSHLFTAQSRPPLLALAGTDFLLPCSCPEEEKSILIWQKNLSVVAQYDPEDDEQVVDGSFRNRTRLYYPAEKDNCSLLLRRASVKDEGNYSCYYKSERMKRIDVELLVAAQYTPQVESVPPESEGSTGPGVYRCQAAGGYPVGRLRWLLDDRPVNSTFTTRRSVRDHLYNLTSTVSVGVPEGAVLRCVVENPRLEGSVSAELTVRSSVTTDVTAVPTASERGSAHSARRCPAGLLRPRPSRLSPASACDAPARSRSPSEDVRREDGVSPEGRGTPQGSLLRDGRVGGGQQRQRCPLLVQEGDVV